MGIINKNIKENASSRDDDVIEEQVEFVKGWFSKGFWPTLPEPS